MARPIVTGLVPLAHTADVQRALDFYRLLGMEVRGSLRNSAGELQWAHIACAQAELMLTRTSDAVNPNDRSVLFYLYSPDLVALRNHLLANEVKVSEITHPSYMPKGELQLQDPDGYELLIGQADSP